MQPVSATNLKVSEPPVTDFLVHLQSWGTFVAPSLEMLYSNMETYH